MNTYYHSAGGGGKRPPSRSAAIKPAQINLAPVKGDEKS